MQLVLTIPLMSLRHKTKYSIPQGFFYTKLFISLLKNVTSGLCHDMHDQQTQDNLWPNLPIAMATKTVLN